MIIKCYAKINWSLFVKGVFNNGYHDLDMLMQSINLHDTIILDKSSTNIFYINNKLVENFEENLCYKAIKLFNAHIKKNECYRLYLKKNIPIGAGLGGGSSDAAGVLHALNRLHKNILTKSELQKIALSIGADVPFMLEGGFARVQGIGEKIYPVMRYYNSYMLIIFDNIFLSTKDVFHNYICNYEENKTDLILNAIQTNKFNSLNKYKLNSLLNTANSLNNKISSIIDFCYYNGAVVASMTGSGSAVFAIFDSKESLYNAYHIMKNKYTFCTISCTTDHGIKII